VEVAHSWFNRFRKLQIRYEKTDRSYLGLNMLAAAIICFHGSFNYLWPAATGIFALIPLADIFSRKEAVSKMRVNLLYAPELIPALIQEWLQGGKVVVAHAAVELSHGLGDAAHAFGFDGADGEAPQTGHVLRAVTDAYPAASISKHAIPAMSYPSRPQKNRL
jgi:hypothetical protein